MLVTPVRHLVLNDRTPQIMITNTPAMLASVSGNVIIEVPIEITPSVSRTHTTNMIIFVLISIIVFCVQKHQAMVFQK